jgi:hypothetical protein
MVIQCRGSYHLKAKENPNMAIILSIIATILLEHNPEAKIVYDVAGTQSMSSRLSSILVQIH